VSLERRTRSTLVHPVVLTGGSGTRLWPLSRERYPKQLLSLTGNQTLLQQTVCRLDDLEGVAALTFICNEEYRFLVAEQLRELGCKPGQILLEPAGRNTAPALTFAALFLQDREGDALMLAMPADHMIRDNTAFHTSLRQGMEYASRGKLVTFGIAPCSAESEYGYIRRGDDSRVVEFVEKPDVTLAQRYVESGEYFWNSGIFMVRVSTWLQEIKQYRPDILAACTEAYVGGHVDGDFFRADPQAFLRCPSESIDYAVMEHTRCAVVIPLDSGWSDVGGWPALWEISKKDEYGNVICGDVCTLGTQGSLLLAQHRLLATVGVDNLVVIETPDAVLVMHRNQAQHVKELVEQLRTQNRQEYHSHRRVHRPWGYYEGVDAGECFQVKRLTIKPGAALSLQLHERRAEHWVVVKGRARVTRGEETFELGENESTYIPFGTKHRLENASDTPLEIIEVQSGSYLGEDDIVRFEDRYNRHNPP
jgi:mannose-1-phosphate guanylyltransferase/mannose-6-phosphate isomerase